MNPTTPTSVMPSAQTLIVSQTSLRPGFFANRRSLEQEFKKEPNPKSTHLFRFLHKRRNDLYIRIFPDTSEKAASNGKD
jgi:hypothetical protein